MSEEGQSAASHGKQPAGEGAALPQPRDDSALHDASSELSPTSQTTTSVSPAGEGKWRCELCTYENYPLSRKCTMCRSAKPALNEDIFKLQEGASALPAPAGLAAEDAGAEALAERLRPLRVGSPPGVGAAAAPHKWCCASCTYENWPRAARCAMCGAAPVPPDWLWLRACLGVLEDEPRPVEAYLAAGGDAARALTQHEVALLDRASAFDAGHTLVHLAIRFQRQDILSALLARISGGGSGLKRSPSYVAPDLAAAIRRQLASSMRYRKAPFPCRYINEVPTFSLPHEIRSLEAGVQQQLYSELLDGEAQATLEAPPAAVNWSSEACGALGSRLHALWNRSCGDCLPDAVCQAACGVADRDNTLRGALHELLAAGRAQLYPRWAAWERAQAARLQYAPEETQLRAEWARLAAAARAPGAPLHQLHVWALAHVARRPLIVYGVDVVRSFRGEPLGFARFRGVYLPLLWEPALCSKSPLCLGYTRGHFSALVASDDAGAGGGERAAYLPLADAEGRLLPVPFLAADEDAEGALRRWTRAVVTRGGVLAARQTLPARPLLQAQMLEEWLNRYRRLQLDARAPEPSRALDALDDRPHPDD